MRIFVLVLTTFYKNKKKVSIKTDIHNQQPFFDYKAYIPKVANPFKKD